MMESQANDEGRGERYLKYKRYYVVVMRMRAAI